MPRPTNRETVPHVFFDTHRLEPGQVITALSTTMSVRVRSLGLRLVGTTRDEEQRLLDHFLLTIEIGNRRYGPFPGGLCGTLLDATHRGYVITPMLTVVPFERCHVKIEALPTLPCAVVARVMLFTLRDVRR